MKELISKCGMNCSQCPAFQENCKTEEDRILCSEGWGKYVKINISPDGCICSGCQHPNPWSGNRVLPDRFCLIRKCAVETQVPNCGACFHYPCALLLKSKKGATYLDRLREEIPSMEYEKFVRPYSPSESMERLNQTHEKGDLIKPEIKPLKTNLSKPGPKTDRKYRDFYLFIEKIFQARTELYYDQILFKTGKGLFKCVLWVFGKYGEIENTSLVINQDVKNQPKCFSSIVRKDPLSLHTSLLKIIPFLQLYKVHILFYTISNKKWRLELSFDSNLDHIIVLKEYIANLISLHGDPEYIGQSKYKGDAFKKFSQLRFDH